MTLKHTKKFFCKIKIFTGNVNTSKSSCRDVEKRINDARQRVLRGEASPLLYFMELKLMDTAIVASYTGFWKWQIKRHLKPGVFKKLPEKKLKKYADVFELTVEELKNVK